MLQEMRKFTKSWIANIFLGALTLSFVSWGIGDIFRGGSSTAVATVGSASIEASEFQRDYTNSLKQIGLQRGKPITPEEARKADLGNQILQRDISRLALDNVARDHGLTATDAMVSQQIQSMSQFAGPTGSFNKMTFLQAINQQGYSEQGFINAVRLDMIRTQLMYPAYAGFQMPPGYTRAILAYAMELRAARYIVVDPKSLPPLAPPSESVLEGYIKLHPEQFSTPEYRDVTYAEISPADVAASIKPTEQQIEAQYEKDKDQYIVPERRTLEQIIFPTEAEAQAARAKIQSGTGFAQIAAERGEKPSDIALGDLTQADLEPSQAKAVFSLPASGVTAPLKVPSGWALIHVSQIQPGKTTTLDQARPELTKEVTAALAQAKLTDIANGYTDASSSGLNLVQAAKKAGMQTGHIQAVDANGMTPQGTKAAIPDDPEFLARAFKAEVGEEGDPVSTKAGNLFVVSVNGIVPPKLKPLSAVRDQALAAWSAQQRAIQLRQQAAQLTDLANKDKSLDAAAKTIGATVQSSPALGHATSDATFSRDFVDALFHALPGQVVYGPKGSGGGYVVGQLTGIAHPLPPMSDPEFLQGLRTISSRAADGIIESMAAAASAKQGVQINAKNLNGITGEGS